MPCGGEFFQLLRPSSCVENSAALLEPRARIVCPVQEQARTTKSRSVVHWIMPKAIKSGLFASPKDQQLSAWEGGHVQKVEANKSCDRRYCGAYAHLFASLLHLCARGRNKEPRMGADFADKKITKDSFVKSDDLLP